MGLRLVIQAFAASVVFVAVGCSGMSAGDRPPSGDPSPIATGAQTPSMASTASADVAATLPVAPSGSVDVATVGSPAQAAALVFASNPTFSSIVPSLSSAAGQTTSYTATESGPGFAVTISMGSGDCLSGCINQHTWNYAVSHDGRVSLTSETGDPVEVPVEHGTSDPATITLRLLAGPVCPVDRYPPDPSCAPRPVAGANVIVRNATGAEAASGTSDAAGLITLSVPGGAYYVEGAPSEGLMRTPQPTAFSVPGGRSVTISLEYDTGIR